MGGIVVCRQLLKNPITHKFKTWWLIRCNFQSCRPLERGGYANGLTIESRQLHSCRVAGASLKFVFMKTTSLKVLADCSRLHGERSHHKNFSLYTFVHTCGFSGFLNKKRRYWRISTKQTHKIRIELPQDPSL